MPKYENIEKSYIFQKLTHPSGGWVGVWAGWKGYKMLYSLTLILILPHLSGAVHCTVSTLTQIFFVYFWANLTLQHATVFSVCKKPNKLENYNYVVFWFLKWIFYSARQPAHLFSPGILRSFFYNKQCTVNNRCL